MNSGLYRVNRPEVIDEKFDGEFVVVNLKTGIYYSLNSTSATIWDVLNARATRAAILHDLQQRYDAESMTLETHLDHFLNELLQEQLIVLEPTTNHELPAVSQTPFAARAAFTPPSLEKYSDMQTLLLLDPIHQVDESGWPSAQSNGH